MLFLVLHDLLKKSFVSVDKLSSGRSEQGSQKSLQLNTEYEQASWTLDSRDSRFMRLNKVSSCKNFYFQHLSHLKQSHSQYQTLTTLDSLFFYRFEGDKEFFFLHISYLHCCRSANMRIPISTKESPSMQWHRTLQNPLHQL